MTKKNQNETSAGFAIIEVMVSITLVSVFLVTFQTMLAQTKKIERDSRNRFNATLYANTMLEATKDLEQSNWNELGNCIAPCHPGIDLVGSKWVWKMHTGEEKLDNNAFTRSLTIEPVYRDHLAFPNSIVASGGVLDPNTKKATANISWNAASGGANITLTEYLYRLP